MGESITSCVWFSKNLDLFFIIHSNNRKQYIFTELSIILKFFIRTYSASNSILPQFIEFDPQMLYALRNLDIASSLKC